MCSSAYFLLTNVGKAENASRVRGRQIGVELPRHCPLEILGFVLLDIHHFPNHLKFRRGGFEHIVRRWCATGILDRFEGLWTASVNIEIDVADVLDVVFRSALSVALEAVHSDIHV